LGPRQQLRVVRFKGDGALGLLGLPADVKLVLPVRGQAEPRSAILNVLTGRKPRGNPHEDHLRNDGLDADSAWEK